MTSRAVVASNSLTIRMDLCDALNAAGFEARPCSDLQSANSITRSETCALVILDLVFPDGNGIEFLATLKSSSATRDLPVMLLAQEHELQATATTLGLSTGLRADEYVGKPYDLARVIAGAVALTDRDASPRPRRRHVVVVDDSATYRNQVKEALEAAGYMVHEAASGEQGLALVANVRPDAVVVDGVLPGIDGATMVRRLKSDSAFRSTPCLLLTATDTPDDELRSLEAGVDAYVHKSQDLAIILTRLSALLRRSRSADQDAVPSLLRPKRLLAIDDSATYLAELADVLRAEGHEVLLASSGEEGLEVLSREEVDCILLDRLMPGLSGQETCRLIKQSPEGRDIPLVMLTAQDDQAAVIEGINAGADDYIAKSSDFDLLKARLRAQLRRKHFEDENRRVRESLVRRETEARFQRLLHSNIIGVLFGDIDGRITDANAAFLDMLGFTRAELDAGVLRNDLLTPPECRAQDRLAIEQLKATGSATPYAKEFYRKNGDRLPVVLGMVLLDGPNTMVGFVLDRTVQQRADEKIRDYTLALEGANRELALAKEQAEQTSQFKSSFLANMSHELRTPLNSIIGFAELLYDGHVSPEMPEHHEFLGDILTSGRHLLQLINDVLDLSKVEAGRLEFHPEQLDLPLLIREVLTVLRPLASSKQIRVETALHPKLTDVFLDPARLKQVLYNFLSNAIKFTPPSGRIVVRTLPEGVSAFRLLVEDTGVGIAAEDLGRLFTEFEQLDAGSAKKHGGTGLGLALTKRLVESQGGSVGVHSVPSEGSTFYAILPYRDREHTPAQRAVSGSSDQTILVVEAVESIRTLTVRALTAAGYTVETSVTATDAVAACRTRSYAGITINLLLPQGSVLDLLREIRSEGANRHTPVVLFAPVAEQGGPRDGSVSDVLGKPLDQAALSASLRKLGVPTRASVLVVDADADYSTLMAAALQQLGYRAAPASSPEAALRLCEEEAPAAVILDLLMPNAAGFGFLERFQRLYPDVPLIIWTQLDLSSADYARLGPARLAVVQKGRDFGTAVKQEVRVTLSTWESGEPDGE